MAIHVQFPRSGRKRATSQDAVIIVDRTCKTGARLGHQDGLADFACSTGRALLLAVRQEFRDSETK